MPPPAAHPHLDVLVVGSGVAGLSAAVRLAGTSARVGVLTKGELVQSATRWAQGGVAAVLGGDEDSTDLHLADTLAAGAGLCDLEAVRILVDEGPGRVLDLIALGANFDRTSRGTLELAREGGHSLPRIVHAGGTATGAEVERALVEATVASAAAIYEHWFAARLVVRGGRCRGVEAIGVDGTAMVVEAEHTILATGGSGQLFAVTTNPVESTADGLAMAVRAGVAVADVEFMQFHPTALHHPAMPRPLLSEALRGHGALLRDAHGERFVDELAPRDVVSRAMAQRMRAEGVDHLWLDATGLEGFADRFPTIAASVRAIGLDPGRDWLPIAPAAHYHSGGVMTDLHGASELPGLWAAGEVACTGVHGANRLASNSLLEGMVFGARTAEAIERGAEGPEPSGVLGPVLRGRLDDRGALGPGHGEPGARADGAHRAPGVVGGEAIGAAGDPVKARDGLQRAMTEGAGVVRDADSLARATAHVAALERDWGGWASPAPVRGDAASRFPVLELANLATGARALLAAATLRGESRGAHSRSDFPGTDPAWTRRIVLRGGRVTVSDDPVSG